MPLFGRKSRGVPATPAPASEKPQDPLKPSQNKPPSAPQVGTSTSTPSKDRTPPDLDRQRALAACLGNPRRFLEEATKARYDYDTIRSLARPPAPHAGVSTLMALHGGAWTREEIALEEALQKLKLDLDTGIGSAKECLASGEEKGHPGMDDLIRDTARDWREMVMAWEGYRGKKDKVWRGRVMDQVGGLVGNALGIVA